jgi:hypothetical protein
MDKGVDRFRALSVLNVPLVGELLNHLPGEPFNGRFRTLVMIFLSPHPNIPWSFNVKLSIYVQHMPRIAFTPWLQLPVEV